VDPHRALNSPGRERGAQSGPSDPGDVPLGPRAAGVQLHITSLPGGRLGRPAYEFVDWLAAAGQRWWQLLPLGPPNRHRSPYKARSAFAAWSGFLAHPRAPVSRAALDEFRDRNGYWARDWERFAGGDALVDQVRFEREWQALRAYAAERRVALLGDLAIYVAAGGADHASHPEIFQRGEVAGAPPDAFSAIGQLWGNPLYDWPALAHEGYRWWTERLRRSLKLFDVVRIDHFRGFVAYWSVPARAQDARAGRWRRGPGRAMFDAASRELGGSLPLVAEDLGVITPAVRRLRDRLGLPGMLVIQFGFDPHRPGSPHRPRNHVEHRIVYTGTHDHDTARGWYERLQPELRRRVDRELSTRGISDPEPWWRLIALAHSSPARVAIVPAQDLLGLGSSARMNDPTRTAGNWRWQLEPGALTASLGRRLRELTIAEGRFG
jgi:4-alpha-glucanotransferase